MKTKYLIFCLYIVMQPLSYLMSQNIEAGKKLLLNENYSAAISEFNNQLKSNSSNPENYYYLGKAYFYAGKTDSANYFFQLGLSKDKNYPLNYIGLGGIALVKNDTALATSQFNLALDLDNNNPDVYLNIADIYLHSGNKSFSDPKYYLEQALSQTKKYTSIYTKLGELYLEINDGTLAITNFKKAIDYDSTNVVAIVGLGNVYKAIKDYAEAENCYKDANRINPDYSVAYKELSDLYSRMDKSSEAVEYFKDYLNFSESTFSNQENLAFLLYADKKYEECKQVLLNMQNIYPLQGSTLHLLAYTYAQLGDPINGIPVFEKYMTDEKNQNEITVSDYELLSSLYLVNHQDSLATKTLLNVLKMDSTRTDIYNKISLINYKIKNWNGVISALQGKLKAEGKLSAQEYFDIGKAYYFNNDYNDAIIYLQKLEELKPDFPATYRWIAAAKSNLDPESEQGLAKPDYEKFISLAGNDTSKYKVELIEAYSYLGYYYFLKKDYETSKSYWQKVYLLDPENAQAKEAIKKIK